MSKSVSRDFLKRQGGAILLPGVLLASVLFLLFPTLCQGQTTDPWAQVKLDAASLEANQRTPAVQARLQHWFVQRVEWFQHVLDDTFIGGANPPIIDLGNFTGFLHQFMSPPTGQGPYFIIFNDAATAGVPVYGPRMIQFQQANINAYINDPSRYNTCWHELQHVVTMDYQANGTQLLVPLLPYQQYMKPPLDNDVEHIYMEGLGELMTEWLDKLCHKSRLAGSGYEFEKMVQEAGLMTEDYQKRAENVTYFEEHHIWSKAHDAWCQAWKEALKIAPLPPAFHDDYQHLFGVRIGFVEDVIHFYMQGGVRLTDGTPVKVPEWVMWANPLISGVIVGHLNESKDINAGILRYGFDVRLMQTYRQHEISKSLNHGKATIALENGDPETILEVTPKGRLTQTSSRPVEVDLTGFGEQDSIRITFGHSDLNKLAGKKQYKISVEYEDDPRIEGGVQKPSFYYRQRAVYFIIVTGMGTQKPKTTVPVTALTPVNPVSSAGGGSKKGEWILTRTWTEKANDPTVCRDSAFKFDIGETGARIESDSVNMNKTKRMTATTAHSWTHPGTRLKVGEKKTLRISAASPTACQRPRAGGVMDVFWDRPDLGSTWVDGVYRYTDGGRGSLPITSDRRIGNNVTCSVFDQTNNFADVEFAEILEAAPGAKLLFTFGAARGAVGLKSCFEYTFVAGDPQPEKTEEPAASLTAKEPTPPPDPPQLDNVAPEPGEVAKWAGDWEVYVLPPKEPRVDATRWYNHPSGGYRFKLSTDWRVESKKFIEEINDGFDTLWPGMGDSMLIVCSREENKNAGSDEEAILNNFTKKMLLSNPGGVALRVQFGQAKGVQIAVFNQKAGSMTWHVALAGKSTNYYVAVMMQAKAFVPAIPDPMAWMLGSSEMLK